MTYNARYREIIDALGLRSVRVRLRANEREARILWLTPDAAAFVERVGRDDPDSPFGADLTPKEQLFVDFVTGVELVFDRQFHALTPIEDGVWELKTVDLRLFGWFIQPDEFVTVCADWADRVKRHRLYSGYRDQVAAVRRKVGAEPDHCVWGGDPNDVLSVRDR